MSPGAPPSVASRIRGIVIALAAFLVVAALLPHTAGAATSTFPTNGNFAAGQGAWTEDQVCSGSLLPGLVCSPLLATTENFVTDPAGDGNPAPAIGFRATFLAGALNLATPVSVWASPEFTYEAAAPTAISFGYDRRTAIGDLLSLPDSSAAAQVVLVRTDAAGETVILDERDLEGSAAFRRVSADVPPPALAPGGTYRLELRTQFRVGALVAVQTQAEILYDNVRLTVEAPDAPEATTLPATGAGAGALDLFGEVDPNGAPTEYVFQFGPTAALGSQTDPLAIGDGDERLTVTRRITGTPGDTVFFRVRATSPGGTAQGEILQATFPLQEDPGPAPTTQTLPAQGDGAGILRLFGTVNPNGLAARYRFDYGPTPALGLTTLLRDIGDGTTAVTVSERINGTPGSDLFYGVVGVSAGGTAQGQVLQARFPAEGDDGDGGGGQGNGGGTGAGGLGACTADLSRPSAEPPRVNQPGRVRLSRRQLLINQRISQAGVRRVNAVIDRLTAGLTANDFRDCSVGVAEFDPVLVAATAGGAAAVPPTAGAAARPTPNRPTGGGDPRRVALSRQQLLINQRISQAAVRRVNAIRERLNGDVTAGDIRAGALTAVKLDTRGRLAFNRALPAGGDVPTAFRPLELRNLGRGDPRRVTLSRQQLLINQRISQAAVRRINQVRAELRMGLTGLNVRDGSLARATLSPGIQSGTGG